MELLVSLFIWACKCPLVFGLSSNVTFGHSLEGKWEVTKSIDEEIEICGLVLICAPRTNSRVNLVFPLDDCRKCKLYSGWSGAQEGQERSGEYNKTTL